MTRRITLRGRLSRAYAGARHFLEVTASLAITSSGKYSANERAFLSDEAQLLRADLDGLLALLNETEEPEEVPDA